MYDCNIAIDLEFTPSQVRGAALKKEIIEIGAVRVPQEGEVLDTFQTLVKPEYSHDVSRAVHGLTGICAADLVRAPGFADAISDLAEWVGTDNVRMVCWDKVDMRQVRNEASAKDVELPVCLRRWMDLQVVYPRAMHVGRGGRSKMALSVAAGWCGVDMDERQAHRALYDAHITGEILASLLSGDYREQRARLDDSMAATSGPTSSIGAKYGDKLLELKRRLEAQAA